MTWGQIPAEKVILALILVLFLIKGVILSFLMPVFQNPDEQIHYGTVQYLAEPTPKTWPIEKLEDRRPLASNIATYGLSEETIRSAQIAQFDELKSEKQNTQDFSTGARENEILDNNWKRYIDIYPTSASGTVSVYYIAAAWLEQWFADESILVRMFTMRLLAVLFGLGTIILGFLIAKKIGLSEYGALLVAALLAFQPMFSITAAQINIDIALIFAFTLFLYAGVSLLKDGLSLRYALLALLAAILGLFSKGPGIVLVALLYPLLAWTTYKKLGIPGKAFLQKLAGATLMLVAIALVAVPQSYWIGITNFTKQSAFDSPLQSLGQYLDKSLRTGEFRDTARSYWGHFGWLDHSIPEWSLSIIILVTMIGLIGTLRYLFSRDERPGFLPEKKYVVFFLGTMIALQVAIRFYDWRVFDYTKEILIGQPGRYFLPAIVAHLLVVVTGLGFLLRQEARLVLTLKILTLSVILLQLHALVNVIIPRYYL